MSTSLLTLTGNSGGGVGPDIGRNIDLVGSGSINVAGNPGTNTLTITLDSTATTYTLVNTSPYVVLTTDEYISVDCSSIAITLQFPDTPVLGKSFTVKDQTGSCATNHITLTTVTGATDIDAAVTFVMNTNYESLSVMGNGTTYEVF